MFSSVVLESSDRIRQATLQLANIKKMEFEAGTSSQDIIKIHKGLFFISLYAAIEFTITASSSQFLSALQIDPQKPIDYKKYILCSALNSEFNALTSGAKKGIWNKKVQLLDSIFSDQVAEFDNTVFPTDGRNITYNELADVWKLFHLPEPIVPEGIHPWLISEIKNHRNAIAHGREKADTIGGRFTIELLENRLRAVDMLCSHIVTVFIEHYRTKSFLNIIV